MEYGAEKVGNVKELGDIYRVDAHLDEQLKAFGRVGINTLATPEEIAQIRLAGIADAWSRTSIAPIAVKGAKTILVRNSPLMNSLMASSAVKAHRANQYLQVGKEVYGIADETAKAQLRMEPEDREAIVVSGEGDFAFTVGMDETRFSLGKTAQSYFGKFVKGGKEGKIQFYNLSGVSKDSATINYLWFGSPQYGSYLGAGDGDLDDDSRAFGVLRTGGASAQKNGLSYTEARKSELEAVESVLGLIPELKGLGKKIDQEFMRRLTGKIQ